MWLLNEFLSLKNNVNAPSESDKQTKTWRNFFLLTSWRSMTKIVGSGSASGSVSQRYGSADPDTYKYFMDPQHWIQQCRLVCEKSLSLVGFGMSCLLSLRGWMVWFGMSCFLSLRGWMVWFSMSCFLSLSVSEERWTPVVQQQVLVLRPLQQLHVCKSESGLMSRSYNSVKKNRKSRKDKYRFWMPSV